jgi:tyrosine phenol-lyase
MYFTTTRLHQELAGGTFVDIIIDEAHDPQASTRSRATSTSPSSSRSSPRSGAERIPYVSLAVTVNMAGGQPVSMANLRAVKRAVRAPRHQADVRRHALAENAYFIQQREPGYADQHPRRSCTRSAP